MPTPPHSSVLPPLESSEAIQFILSEALAVLEEVRNEGTWVLSWLGNVRAPDPLRLTPVLLLRHFVETLDGIISLIRSQSIEPASILLRTLVEVWWHIVFITETDRDRRSAAYLVWYYHQRRKSFQRYLRDDDLGKQYQADVAKDKYGIRDEYDSLDQDEVRRRIDDIDAILRQPEYAEMESRYQDRMKTKNNRPRSWHDLAGGAADIEGLARALGMPLVYHLVYRRLSGTSHGSDIMEGRITAAKGREGMGAIKQIHLLDNLIPVVHYSILTSISTYRHIVDAYDPVHREEIRRWYKREIRDYLFNRLPKIQINTE